MLGARGQQGLADHTGHRACLVRRRRDTSTGHSYRAFHFWHMFLTPIQILAPPSLLSLTLGALSLQGQFF